MRMMLSALQENRACDEHSVLDCQNQLRHFLKTPIGEEAVTLSTQSAEKMTSGTEQASQQATPKKSQQETSPSSSLSTSDQIGWYIQFKPYPSMLKTGNDPINLFRELANLGELTVKADTHQLPHLTDMDPQACYLSWELTLHTATERTVIEELFEWVEDECELLITPLGEEQQPSAVEVVSNEAEIETEPQPESPQPTSQPEVIPAPVETSEITTYQVAPELEPVVKAEDKVKISKESTLDESSSRNLMGQTVEASSIRVGIDKIDHLINIVGELVITQSMLDQVGENFDESKIVQLRDGLSQLERNTRELQESVMRVRMLPISFSFNRFPRLVHDLSLQLGKKVELKLSGEQTELDKTVLEKMSDPLVHLVRNALDHGIEMPEQRRQVGKLEVGTLHLHAFHQGGSIVIQISDDGAGVDLDKVRAKAIKQKLLTEEETVTDEQLYELIFQPGFSTVTQVNDLSGRGVGMDVVRRNIRSLGGTIDIHSKPGQGTTFNIRLPLTLAILDGQLVRVGQQIYILSLLSIIESLRVKPQLVNSLAGKAEVYKLRDEYIPILRLYALFGIASATTQLDQGLLVVVEGDGHKIGLFVDELLSQQQIVIKSLETNYKQVSGISGATILGDGNVALILDIAGLIKLFRSQTNMPMFSGVTL
jgi:two-component system chemotaxis sensor kinase CheA